MDETSRSGSGRKAGTPEIDSSSPIPLYYQLKRLILHRLERGELRPGDKVPTESEFCERYRVSRTPVRQALLELTQEGVLVRRAGRGTFVRQPETRPVTLRVTIPDQRWRAPLDEAVELLGREDTLTPLELAVEVVPLAQLHDALLLSVAQGRAPDISVVDTAWVAELADRRYLFPIEDLDPHWEAEVRSSFFPQLLTACAFGGSLHAVPANADATVLWYRRDLLAAEQLEPPGDWEALLAVGRHFQRREVRERYRLSRHPLTFAAGRSAGETATYQLLPLLWAAGGDLVDGGEVVVDSGPTRRTMAFLRELVQQEEIAPPGVTAQSWDGPLTDLAEGRAVMALGGTYEYYLIQKAAGLDEESFRKRIGFAAPPRGPARLNPRLIGGMGYAITQQSRHPQEALRLLRLALSPQVLEHLSLATQQHSAHLTVAARLETRPDTFLAESSALFSDARPRPPLADYARVSRQFLDLAERCIGGREPIAELTRRAAERISGVTGLPLAGESRAA